MTEAEQIEFIRANYLTMPAKRIAKAIGRSGCFVSTRMKKMSLLVPADTINQWRRDSQFKKGQMSFNKGLKIEDYMSPEGIRNSARTRFKAGRKPHNTKYDGHVWIRNSKGYDYKVIRISERNYEPMHRKIWEAYNGPIPPDMNVQFKDGNTLNCAIENLYLISRSEQVQINRRGGKALPFEVQKLVIIVNNLNKKIDEKRND